MSEEKKQPMSTEQQQKKPTSPADIAEEWIVNEKGSNIAPMFTYAINKIISYPAIGLEPGKTYVGKDLRFVKQYLTSGNKWYDEDKWGEGWDIFGDRIAITLAVGDDKPAKTGETLDKIRNFFEKCTANIDPVTQKIKQSTPANQQGESVEEKPKYKTPEDILRPLLIGDSVFKTDAIIAMDGWATQEVRIATHTLTDRVKELEIERSNLLIQLNARDIEIASNEEYSQRLLKQIDQLKAKQPQVSGDVEQEAQEYTKSKLEARDFPSLHTPVDFIAGAQWQAAQGTNNGWVRVEDLQKVIYWIERDRHHLVGMSGINPGSVAYDTCVSRLKALLPPPTNNSESHE